MKPPLLRGGVLDGVDWDRRSVVLLKPDCLRRQLVAPVLARLRQVADIHAPREVRVADWQIFVHYWDLLVDADWFDDLDIPGCLRQMYVDQDVLVALAEGPSGTPARLRALLGHFDPTRAPSGTIRRDFGHDSLAAARSEGRLVNNLIHTSDDADAARRDFGTWYGAAAHTLLTQSDFQWQSTAASAGR